MLGGLLLIKDRVLGHATCFLRARRVTPGYVCLGVWEGKEGHRALTSFSTVSGIVGTCVFGDSVLIFFLHKVYDVENNIFYRRNLQSINSHHILFSVEVPCTQSERIHAQGFCSRSKEIQEPGALSGSFADLYARTQQNHLFFLFLLG